MADRQVIQNEKLVVLMSLINCLFQIVMIHMNEDIVLIVESFAKQPGMSTIEGIARTSARMHDFIAEDLRTIKTTGDLEIPMNAN